MLTGTIRRYNGRGGYGFIATEKHPEGVYFHASACRGGFVPPLGADVTFQICAGKKRPQAYAVTVIELPEEVLEGQGEKEATCKA